MRDSSSTASFYGYDFGSRTATSTELVVVRYSTGATTAFESVSVFRGETQIERALRLSDESLARMVAVSKLKSIAPAAVRSRHSFQQFARLPCYRSPRTR